MGLSDILLSHVICHRRLIVDIFMIAMLQIMLVLGTILTASPYMDTFARHKQALSIMPLRNHPDVMTFQKSLNINSPNLMAVVINTNPQGRHGKRQKLPVNKWEDRI